MNKLLLVLILLGLSSCSSPNYEKAIADWIQTDETGTWTDMKFELLEVQETKDLTVGDSVNILKRKIDNLNKIIERAENPKSLIKIAPSTYFNTRDQMKSAQRLLDSSYNDRDSTEVLARYLKCKYSIFSPLLHVRQEKVETFLLTPDMKNCLARMKKNI